MPGPSKAANPFELLLPDTGNSIKTYIPKAFMVGAARIELATPPV